LLAVLLLLLQPSQWKKARKNRLTTEKENFLLVLDERERERKIVENKIIFVFAMHALFTVIKDIVDGGETRSRERRFQFLDFPYPKKNNVWEKKLP
jgi:hypothetical protein